MENRIIIVDTLQGETYVATRGVNFKHTRKYLLASGRRIGFPMHRLGTSVFELRYEPDLFRELSVLADAIESKKQQLYGICSRNFLKQTDKSRKINEVEK